MNNQDLHVDATPQLNEIEDGAMFCTVALMEVDDGSITIADHTDIVSATMLDEQTVPIKGSVIVSGVMHRADGQANADIISITPCDWDKSPFLLMPPDCLGSTCLDALIRITSGISDTDLIRFLNRFFLDEKVCRPFLNYSASYCGSYHHGGGLAFHSLDVAEQSLECEWMMSKEEKDAIVVAALIHQSWRVLQPEFQQYHLNADNTIRQNRERRNAVHFLAAALDDVMEYNHPSRLRVIHALTGMGDSFWSGLLFPDSHMAALLAVADQGSDDQWIERERDQAAAYARQFEQTAPSLELA